MPEPAEMDRQSPSVVVAGRKANKDDLMKIYEIYERSAQQISDRRQSANSFYLSICTAIVGIVSFMDGVGLGSALLSVAGVVICVLWRRAITSYRDINGAKFRIIHEIEELLPLRPFTVEWNLLDEGNNPKRYRPFAGVEMYVPVVFAVIFLLAILLNSVSWQEGSKLLDAASEIFRQAVGHFREP
jgi:hypothetical protein